MNILYPFDFFEDLIFLHSYRGFWTQKADKESIGNNPRDAIEIEQRLKLIHFWGLGKVH